jgi:hypothetical protein
MRTLTGFSQVDTLPVAGRLDTHKLEGVVTLRDVLDSYGMWTPAARRKPPYLRFGNIALALL